MGAITWTKSFSASDNGSIFSGTDIQNIQADITTVVNGGITNSNVNASAAIDESKIAFSTSTGHSHDGVGSQEIGSVNDAIMRGLEISDTANDDALVTIRPGVGYHGSTKVAKTADTAITFAVSGDWYDGAVDSYAGGAGWCYVGYDSTSDIKLLGANPPDVDDSAGNSVAGATKYYFDDSGGGSAKYWRVVGAVYVDTDNQIHAATGGFQRGNIWMYDIPVNIATVHKAAWFTQSCSTGMPAISTMGIFGLEADGSLETGQGVFIKPNGSTWATNPANGVYLYDTQAATYRIGGQRWCATDTSQNIEYQSESNDVIRIDVEGYQLDIR